MKRILIVDGEERLAFLLKQSLKGLGDECEILTTPGGQEALERVRAQPFDLIITDYRLKDMNGLQLTSAVKAMTPKTPIILMTAYDSEELEAQAKSLKVYSYLAKPFPIEEIIRLTRQALEI
ncbi:MAG: response regulator [Anaerolineae bacterium]